MSLFGTPIWPWFHDYLSGHESHFRPAIDLGVALTMLFSVALVGTGVGLGWRLYGRKPLTDAAAPDALEQLQPAAFGVLRGKFYIDELYEISVIRFHAWCARGSRWLDDTIWNGVVNALSGCVLALSWLSRFIDELVVNFGFDEACRRVRDGARLTARLQDGKVQNYLRVIGLSLAILLLFLIWGRGQ